MVTPAPVPASPTAVPSAATCSAGCSYGQAGATPYAWYTGIAVQTVLPNGDTFIPMTNVKEVMANNGLIGNPPLGMPMPFFYPPGFPPPQEMVDYWAGARRWEQQGPLQMMTRPLVLADLAYVWSPRVETPLGDLFGPNDWKRLPPLGVYDGTANFMFGATSAAYGVSLGDLIRVGNWVHPGGNPAVNNASIISGYFVVGQGWRLQLVPYTVTWRRY